MHEGQGSTISCFMSSSYLCNMSFIWSQGRVASIGADYRGEKNRSKKRERDEKGRGINDKTI